MAWLSADALAQAQDALHADGFAVVEGLFDPGLLKSLAEDCRAVARRGRMRPARVGSAAARRLETAIRSDAIYWLEADSGVPARIRFLQDCEALGQTLGRRLLLGIDGLEAHYAAYPRGARYRRHLDRFAQDDTRVLSLACYLNPDWQARDGGALRLYLPRGGQLDVLPRLGTTALFLSAEFEHEVLPARRTRYGIAGWFRRRPIGNALPL